MVTFFISTHTPHARRDLKSQPHKRIAQFLLTRLMRGVTGQPQHDNLPILISTHTPHARRDRPVALLSTTPMISTHTPHARRDPQRQRFPVYCQISTHTPHARRDSHTPSSDVSVCNFYSHASCEA